VSNFLLLFLIKVELITNRVELVLASFVLNTPVNGENFMGLKLVVNNQFRLNTNQKASLRLVVDNGPIVKRKKSIWGRKLSPTLRFSSRDELDSESSLFLPDGFFIGAMILLFISVFYIQQGGSDIYFGLMGVLSSLPFVLVQLCSWVVSLFKSKSSQKEICYSYPLDALK
jgi:hypothetical protein